MNVDDIGEGDDALLCSTNKTDCCTNKMGQKRAGKWYFPCTQDMEVGTLGDPARNNAFYRDRGSNVVRLNRRGSPSERGCFRCELLDANNVTQMVFVTVGMFFSIYRPILSILFDLQRTLGQ